MKKLKITIFIIIILLSSCNVKNSENNKSNMVTDSYNTDNLFITDSVIAPPEDIMEDTTETENTISTEEITTEKITEDIIEMEIDISPKEDEITQIFWDNRADFEKIKDIITDNYPYFHVRYEGEGHQYNRIWSGEDFETAIDDSVTEIEYILDFMKKISITVISRPTLGAVGGIPQINFYIKHNNEYQGITYLYEPEDDNYYEYFNERSMSIERRIEGNWFYYYNAPPDAPVRFN